jgi:hypothetical protein
MTKTTSWTHVPFSSLVSEHNIILCTEILLHTSDTFFFQLYVLNILASETMLQGAILREFNAFRDRNALQYKQTNSVAFSPQAKYTDRATIVKNWIPTSRESHSASITKPNRLMLFRETVAVYCEDHTEHINTVFGQNSAILSVKAGGKCNSHCSLKCYKQSVYIPHHTFPDHTHETFDP